MSTEVFPLADSPALPFELGQWTGRHQALAWMASRCSAADAHVLRAIREQKLYRALDMSWESFCSVHAGFSHKKADRIIESLDEFGDAYFHLTEILKIPAPEYRAIQPAIADNALEFEGQRIPIDREHTQQLIEAVRTLRGRLAEQVRNSPTEQLLNRLDRTVGEIGGAIRRSEGVDREYLIVMIEDYANRVVEAARDALAENESEAEPAA